VKEVFQVLFPGLMLLWVCFIANGLFADVMVESRSRTLARLIGSGVSLEEFVLSKVLRCLAVCLICEFILIVFTKLVFDLPWRSPLLLAVVLTSFNLSVLGILALVYGYARSPDLANGITTFLFLTAGALGGGLIPFNELPAGVQTVGQWSMIRLANRGIEGLFQSRPPWEILRPSLILLTGGMLLTVLGVSVLRRRFLAGRPNTRDLRVSANGLRTGGMK